MKSLLLMPALLIIMVLQQGCTASKKTIVAGKNSDLSENFKKIKTYSWTSDIDKIPKDAIFLGPNGVYIFNNESGRKMIKEAVKYEMDSRGYTMNTSNPDILISFSVLEQPGTLQSADGYVTVASGEKVRTKDDISQVKVQPGTLIINFIDAKSNKAVWQGFASGILRADEMHDQAKVREAVSSVFNQFKYNNKA